MDLRSKAKSASESASDERTPQSGASSSKASHGGFAGVDGAAQLSHQEENESASFWKLLEDTNHESSSEDTSNLYKERARALRGETRDAGPP